MNSELHWIPTSERTPEAGRLVGIKLEGQGGPQYQFGYLSGDRWLFEDGLSPDEGWMVSGWVEIRTFPCPLCGHTAHPNTLSDAKILMARCSCLHCANEFLIVDDEVVTLNDYLERNPHLWRNRK